MGFNSGFKGLTKNSGVVIYAARSSDHFCQLKYQVITTIHNLQWKRKKIGLWYHGASVSVSVCVCVCICVCMWLSVFISSFE